MKKTLALVLTVAFLMLTLTGCTGTTVVVGVDCTCEPVEVTAAPVAETAEPEETSAPEATAEPVEETAAVEENTEEAAEEPAEETAALKTGLAVQTSIKDSASATAEAAGAAKYDLTIAAVTVDANGVIESCVIDSVPATVNFDTTGAITSDLAAAVLTKNELGENYGMVAYGNAIAEWDEQVAALASYAEGKTVEELKNGAIDESGKAPEGSDLASSATIYLGGYVSAIEAAVANAKELGAQSGDELVLVTENGIGSSVAATAEKEGTAQLDVNIAVVTKNEGVITSCYIDSVQAKIAFDATGAITTDLSAPVQTKNELGENYGMVAWGNAIAEWDAQAAAFAEYVTGKTAAEVAGIAVTETTKPAEGTDLATSVTITIGGFQNLIAKAFAEVPAAEAPAEEAVEAPAEETAALKTGLAVQTSIKDSASATAEAAGAAKYDLTIAAVTVDANGVIESCVIDSVPATVNFDTTGAITSDLAAAVLTKNELGENYGMVAYGNAIAEWDEQVAALASYAEGKTVEELKNGAIDESGKAPEGSDLASSATIYLGGYVSAIEAAVANAKELGAQSGDELVLVTENGIGSSVAATAEKEGTAQLDVNIAVVTKNEGVITSCYIDSVQAKIAFDATGAITTDLTAPVQTKNELGENYGMVAWGNAIAEWDAQAAAFAEYVTGKTAAEVAGIAVTETTKPAEGTDLATSVTITIGGFQNLIAKAMQ